MWVLILLLTVAISSGSYAQPLDDVHIQGIVRGYTAADTTALDRAWVIIEDQTTQHRDSLVTDSAGRWSWTAVTSATRDHAHFIPADLTLAPSYPSPFAETTTIRILNRVQRDVRLDVYNILGQRVAALLNEPLSPGAFELRWNGVAGDGRALAQGMYFLCLSADGQVSTQKIVLLGSYAQGATAPVATLKQISDTGVEQAAGAERAIRTLDDFTLRLEFRHADYDSVILNLFLPDGRDTSLVTLLQFHDSVLEGMVFVPAGTYSMGHPTFESSVPVHTVNHRAFYIDRFKVTNAAYKVFCDSTGRAYPADPGFSGMPNYFTNPTYAMYPVVMVSWLDARAYADWAGKRLPTEAEWERAAKGDSSNRLWPWGDTWSSSNANSSESDGYPYTSPVGAFPGGVSPAGCYDMSGNVWEYCEDDFHADYTGAPEDGRAWLDNPRRGVRTVRGGSWNAASNFVRCAYREDSNTNTMSNRKGFRCVRDVADMPPELPQAPNPPDSAIHQPISRDLWWTAQEPNADSLFFDVYFGRVSPPSLVASGITEMHYDPGLLEDSATYYWRIDARDTQGNFVTGSQWMFQTIGPVVDGMVLIPAGSYTMGSARIGGAAIPEHTVNVPAFYLDLNKVTNAQYRQFCDATGRSYPVDDPSDFYPAPYFTNPTYANYPVVMVSFSDAQTYAAWAGKRLPTEAEWEMASKGYRDNRQWPWGDVWVAANSNTYSNPADGYEWTSPAGHFVNGVSPVGCYDMVGNLWEWVEDDWHDSFTGAPTDGRAWVNTPRASNRVLKCGSWWRDNTYCRCAYRFANPPGTPGSGIGFRCARSPQ